MQQTAAILLIGDELLSGQVKDRNAYVISSNLIRCGVKIKQLRIVPDESKAVTAAIIELRKISSYLIVSGGIGPTHDDLTAESVASVLDVPLEIHPEILERLLNKYGSLAMIGSRIKLAKIPSGAMPITAAKLLAPGFIVQNMIVMAGVPVIAKTVMESFVPRPSTDGFALSFR
ncbi:MAG: competence/damage-inducible protein A [Afipia felis]|nr:competence/damage-inducible protein A [Afipia felis]